jgi:hypothetical protein
MEKISLPLRQPLGSGVRIWKEGSHIKCFIYVFIYFSNMYSKFKGQQSTKRCV